MGPATAPLDAGGGDVVPGERAVWRGIDDDVFGGRTGRVLRRRYAGWICRIRDVDHRDAIVRR
jgi:hypothetical protein